MHAITVKVSINAQAVVLFGRKGVFLVWSFSQKHLGQKFGRASSPRLFAEPVATDLEAWVYYQPVNQDSMQNHLVLCRIVYWRRMIFARISVFEFFEGVSHITNSWRA